MEYARYGNMLVVRIDKGEEIIAQLTAVAKAEKIKVASVTALGAVGNFTVGVLNVAEKKYYKNTFRGDYEIVSLTGTVTAMDGEIYVHLHFSAGDAQGKVVGGHLNEAFISATCEMVVQVIDGTVERSFDAETGLNLMRF